MSATTKASGELYEEYREGLESIGRLALALVRCRQDATFSLAIVETLAVEAERVERKRQAWIASIPQEGRIL